MGVITKTEFERLRTFSNNPNFTMGEHHWRQMIEYAQAQTEDKANWKARIREYKKQIRLLRIEWDDRKLPPPEVNQVQVVRERLMTDLGIKTMDEPTVLLVEMLIWQIPPKMFEPAQIGESDRERLDRKMISYCRHLLEHEGVKISEAYKLTDEKFKQKPSSTQKRFHRLSKMEWDNVGFGTLDGALVAVKEEHGTPKHPHVVEFLKKYGRPRK
jgi:hypothetical protein